MGEIVTVSASSSLVFTPRDDDVAITNRSARGVYIDDTSNVNLSGVYVAPGATKIWPRGRYAYASPKAAESLDTRVWTFESPEPVWASVRMTPTLSSGQVFEGTLALRAQATGAAGTNYVLPYSSGSSGVPVSPGDSVVVSAWTLHEAPQAFGFYARVAWYTSAGVLISFSEVPASRSNTGNEWVYLNTTAVAPPLAAWAQPVIIGGSSLASSAVMWVDLVTLDRYRTTDLEPVTLQVGAPGEQFDPETVGTATATALVTSGLSTDIATSIVSSGLSTAIATSVAASGLSAAIATDLTASGLAANIASEVKISGVPPIDVPTLLPDGVYTVGSGIDYTADISSYQSIALTLDTSAMSLGDVVAITIRMSASGRGVYSKTLLLGSNTNNRIVLPAVGDTLTIGHDMYLSGTATLTIKGVGSYRTVPKESIVLPASLDVGVGWGSLSFDIGGVGYAAPIPLAAGQSRSYALTTLPGLASVFFTHEAGAFAGPVFEIVLCAMGPAGSYTGIYQRWTISTASQEIRATGVTIPPFASRLAFINNTAAAQTVRAAITMEGQST